MQPLRQQREPVSALGVVPMQVVDANHTSCTCPKMASPISLGQPMAASIVRPVRRRSCGLQCVTLKRWRTCSGFTLLVGLQVMYLALHVSLLLVPGLPLP